MNIILHRLSFCGLNCRLEYEYGNTQLELLALITRMHPGGSKCPPEHRVDLCRVLRT